MWIGWGTCWKKNIYEEDIIVQIYIVNVAAKNEKVTQSIDYSKHYVAADDPEDPVVFVKRKLKNAGWDVVSFRVEIGWLDDIRKGG